MEQITKVIDLIYLAKQNNVDVMLNGERLQLKVPEGINIDQNLLEEIKNNKQQIIDYLKNENWKSTTVEKNHNKINKFDRNMGHIPLSFSQERLWFIDQLEGSVHYQVVNIFRLKGKLNKQALSYSLQSIIDRHEILRTVYLQQNGEAYQITLDTQGWQIETIDGSLYSQDGDELQKYIQTLIRKPFDLSKDFMLRAFLIALSDQNHVLVIAMHHIASDEWSNSILLNELIELYNAYVDDRPTQLALLPIQFADYAVWQRNNLQGEVLEKKINYWKNKLEAVAPLQLPTDFTRPPVKGIDGASVEFAIEKELSDQIQMLCRQEGSSLFMTLLAAFKILLHRYSDQQDICVGTSIANRQQEVEELIGFFVNTVALRSQVKSGESFAELLQEVRSTTMEAYENQDLSLEKVVEVVVKERDLSRNPLFQVMLVLHNTPAVNVNRLGEVELSVEQFKYDTVRFDMTFFIKETTEGLQGNVHYATDLYSEATINRMISHFKTLLNSIVKSPQKKISELTMLTREEKHQLLYEFNDTKVDYPNDKSIVDLFEEQAAKTPDSIAVVFEEVQLTYKELNERANQLAHHLRNKGVSEDTLVPICIDRSAEMIIGIMGILKAGGAYVPIDIEFPKERIFYMLEDSAAALIVTGRDTNINFPVGLDIIKIDGNSDFISNQSIENLQFKVHPRHLAYVIYTSGSTGKPKGVMIEHRNLVDYLFGLKQKTQIDQCKSFALVSTIATDLGNTVLFSSLVFGGSLHLFSKETVSNIENLHQYFGEHKIDCLKIVPSHWKALSVDRYLLLPAKLLIFGGETLESEVAENIRLSGSTCSVINHYGPTETTIGKLLHIVSKDRTYGSSIPIGKPFSNTRIYVLNKELAMCPVGVPGQLFIEGDGVARGYLNNAVLTKQKFIQNPFNNQEKSLMYSTGDLVKYLPDGNIEFIGRVDDQIKIRGFRIELGEIESVLREHKEVRQAAVLAKDGSGGKRLVAYVVTDVLFNPESIIAYLKDRLPDYMVPAVIVELKSLPLTPNGKIDRQALPDPDGNEMLSGKYVAPRNKVEEKLAVIWQDVLELEKVGVNDDFFELGGHSLLAIRLISAIRKEFTVEMPIGDIFEYSTIASLQARLKSQSNAAVLPSIQMETSRPQHIPLSFSQERLWFIDQLEGSVPYHRPMILRIKGALNSKGLAYSLRALVNRHEVLRTVILSDEGQPYQHIMDKDTWELSVNDGLRFSEDFEGLQNYIKQTINKPFDLSKDHMIRANLIVFNDYDNILILTLHHIASDLWTSSVLVKEMMEYYSAYVENRPSELPLLPIQYADYAIWQRNYLQGEILDKKIDYWKGKLGGVAVLELPTDHPRPAIWSTHGASKEFSIDKKLSADLQALSLKQGATLFMTLLAAFKVLLHRYSGQEDICVGSPIANRTQKEVEGLIGFFVNTLALRSEVNSDSSFVQLLQKIKITMLEAYENQETPFEKVVDAVVLERDLSRNPLFQILFALQNTSEVPTLRFGDLNLSEETHEDKTTLFDISFFITETTDGLQLLVQYSTVLYGDQTINRMVSHFKQLLSSIVAAPQEKIGELRMLTQEEEKELLYDFNDTVVDYPSAKTIVDLFEEQASKTPESSAIVFEKEHLSYRDLNERANQLAHYLRSKGIKEDTLVPICIERGIDMIIGILGILKAGGAYVPIDPEYPQERISYMIEDIGATIIVSSQQSRSKILAAISWDIIELDGDWLNIGKEAVVNLQTDTQPHHLAYVIYTSGSTGKPKGVMIEHRSVVNFLMSMANDVEFASDSSILSVTTFSFDICYLEFFLPMICGGKLFIVSREVAVDGFKLAENISSYCPTHLQATPSTWQLLLECEWENKESIIIMIGGEAVKETLKDKLTKIGRVFNLYGPTETTIWSAVKKLDMNNKVSIGKPIANTSIYIVNEQQQLCPVTIAGEIYIGGDGLSRGYLNHPELTAEKFINHPFNKESGEKVYKTGDLGRWLPDGNIEYLKRKDDQVKIRGYRIELGEIESALIKSNLVNQATVLVRENEENNKRLVGYYIPQWQVVKAKERELYADKVKGWQEIYESEYSNTETGIDEEFDINIWKDSFTGEPIPPEHMHEWLQDIVQIILDEKPEHVLEVGTGTGLIYYQLAGKVKKYIGTDFSTSSINRIRENIKKGLKDYGPTELQVCAAHEVLLEKEEPVDTIILNSIIQYFPGEDYMTEVIGKSISLLKGKGRIIIGDVRDNRLLGLFKARLRIEKRPNALAIQEFEWLVEQDILKEEELCFSPEYFYNLKSVYKQITHIEIKWKQGVFINELTLYRYNVIIHVGEEAEMIKPDWQRWSDIADKQTVINQLKQGTGVVALQEVPNPRLWQEQLLSKARKDKLVSTVGDLVNIMDTEGIESKQIKEILSIAQANGYAYRLFLDQDALKVNVLIELNPSKSFIQQPDSEKNNNPDISLTNIPLFSDINLLLQKDIRSLLQQSLPEYMIPSELIALRKMPLTNNGKVDRKFLSQRQERAVVNKFNYEPPGTKIERSLVKIWQELLGIESIGINENFFELGGHSLLAMRVISAIRKELKVDLRIKDLFQYTTISDLSEYIESEYDFSDELDTSSLEEIKI